jgi:uncharacterized LabA/DUF88 family protein
MAVIKHSAQRVGVFIDTANLYHSAKHLYKSKVNFGNVVKEAVANRPIIRAIAYVIATEGGEEKAFFDALTKVGIETKSKDLQIFYGGAKKADWDVGITVDAIKLAPKLDVVIIVSGDGDYVPLIEYLKNMGVQVEVASFGRSSSTKLREAADLFLDLCDSPQKFLMRGSRSGGSLRQMINKAASEETLPEIPADVLSDEG